MAFQRIIGVLGRDGVIPITTGVVAVTIPLRHEDIIKMPVTASCFGLINGVLIGGSLQKITPPRYRPFLLGGILGLSIVARRNISLTQWLMKENQPY